ncbi:DUF721 domain-containing protein [Nocardioides yefusunii]|uniref:DUF721 domain-containing protein n=1 Tax=Nocardioides yefusunii TaxID=2500546 RepID=A0ABW1R2S5_9ACTN|nr:DciA family protein [Nocardioides yefusunii]
MSTDVPEDDDVLTGTTPTVDLPESGDIPPADGLDLARSFARAQSKAPAPVRRASKGGGKERPQRRRGKSAWSGAHPDDRDPQALGNALERLVGNRGWETDLKAQGVFAQWPQLVGEAIAEHCTPEALVDGKLTVRTDSTAWATQLRLLAPRLVKRLNADLGHGTVVVIDVLGPHVPTWKKGLRSSGGRGVRDTYG